MIELGIKTVLGVGFAIYALNSGGGNNSTVVIITCPYIYFVMACATVKEKKNECKVRASLEMCCCMTYHLPCWWRV